MAKYTVLYPVSIKDGNGVATIHTEYGSEIDVNKSVNDVDSLVAGGYLKAVEVEAVEPERDEPADPPTEAGVRQMNAASEPSEAGQSGETRPSDEQVEDAKATGKAKRR